MTTDLPPELEPIVLAVLEKRVKATTAAARAAIGPRYAEGQSSKIRSPLDDAPLGVVGRESPNPTWQIVDRDALAKHLEQDPANVEYVDDIAGTDDQVIEVLAEHAPHLLARIERVRPDAFTAAVKAAAAGEPMPGIARVKSAGRLFVRPDKGAGAAIERLVEAGVITWDGQPKELPAGTSEQPSQPVTADDQHDTNDMEASA